MFKSAIRYSGRAARIAHGRNTDGLIKIKFLLFNKMKKIDCYEASDKNVNPISR
jgi:hypothetical protein